MSWRSSTNYWPQFYTHSFITLISLPCLHLVQGNIISPHFQLVSSSLPASNSTHLFALGFCPPVILGTTGVFLCEISPFVSNFIETALQGMHPNIPHFFKPANHLPWAVQLPATMRFVCKSLGLPQTLFTPCRSFFHTFLSCFQSRISFCYNYQEDH